MTDARLLTSNDQSCKPLSSDELADLQAAFWPGAEPNELRRKLIVAIMQADAKYEAAKVGGTKRWIESFFLPELKAQGLAIGFKKHLHEAENSWVIRPPRYQCLVEGCPANHVSKHQVCTPADIASAHETRDYVEPEAIELLITARACLPDPDFVPTEEEEIRLRSIRDRIDKYMAALSTTSTESRVTRQTGSEHGPANGNRQESTGATGKAERGSPLRPGDSGEKAGGDPS